MCEPGKPAQNGSREGYPSNHSTFCPERANKNGKKKWFAGSGLEDGYGQGKIDVMDFYMF